MNNEVPTISVEKILSPESERILSNDSEDPHREDRDRIGSLIERDE
jgi:hypothetical protein